MNEWFITAVPGGDALLPSCIPSAEKGNPFEHILVQPYSVENPITIQEMCCCFLLCNLNQRITIQRNKSESIPGCPALSRCRSQVLEGIWAQPWAARRRLSPPPTMVVQGLYKRKFKTVKTVSKKTVFVKTCFILLIFAHYTDVDMHFYHRITGGTKFTI